jgi:hypothetical protein
MRGYPLDLWLQLNLRRARVGSGWPARAGKAERPGRPLASVQALRGAALSIGLCVIADRAEALSLTTDDAEGPPLSTSLDALEEALAMTPARVWAGSALRVRMLGPGSGGRTCSTSWAWNLHRSSCDSTPPGGQNMDNLVIFLVARLCVFLFRIPTALTQSAIDALQRGTDDLQCAHSWRAPIPRAQPTRPAATAGMPK